MNKYQDQGKWSLKEDLNQGGKIIKEDRSGTTTWVENWMMSLPAAKVIKKNRQLQDYLQGANRLVPQMQQSFPWYFVMQDTHIYEGAWLWKYRGAWVLYSWNSENTTISQNETLGSWGLTQSTALRKGCGGGQERAIPWSQGTSFWELC